MTINPHSPSLIPSRPVLWICRFLCATALGISAYLAWTAFNASEVYGCGGGEVFDCGHVLTSKYAKIFSIPVSVPAFALYASLLGILFFLRPGTPETLLKAGWALLTVGAISAGLAALWFTGIQVFELKHLCAYCLTAHACGTVLAGILLWKHPLGWGRTFQLSGISVLGIAGLITGQLTAEAPQTFIVERYDDVSVEGTETHLTRFDGPAEAVEDFAAPAEFAPPTEFAAPLEFAAPAPFDAPVEFAPPTDTVETTPANAAEPTDTVEPVEAVEPVVTRRESASTSPPPAAAAEIKKSEPAIPTRIPETPKSDQTTSQSQDDPGVTSIPRTTIRLPVAAGAYLLSSPRRVAVASRLLAMLVGMTDESESNKDDQDRESATTATERHAAKPVIPKPVPERLVTVAGDRFSLNSRHWPLLGDPDARYIFVEMFDYTCPHCRHTHHTIEAAKKQFGDQLAVIALPVPLERACNDAASGNGHPGACEMAKLAVAVWRCDRAKFSEFHNWMFAGQRSTFQAKAKAEQLVGADRLAAELALPHAGNYVSKHVELYKRVGRGAVPKLLFPKSTMTGQVSSTTTLVNTIQRELGQ